MNKAILVIDMPDSCSKCLLMYGNDISDWCLPMGNFNGDVYRHTTDNTKPDWCPLKPIPKKLKGHDSIYYQWGEYEDGWNHCLDVILGDD